MTISTLFFSIVGVLLMVVAAQTTILLLFISAKTESIPILTSRIDRLADKLEDIHKALGKHEEAIDHLKGTTK